MLRVGQKVLVYTASSTFKGAEGRIVEVGRGGARVKLVGDPYAPLHFSDSEIVPASEPALSLTGAE